MGNRAAGRDGQGRELPGVVCANGCSRGLRSSLVDFFLLQKPSELIAARLLVEQMCDL